MFCDAQITQLVENGPFRRPLYAPIWQRSEQERTFTADAQNDTNDPTLPLATRLRCSAARALCSNLGAGDLFAFLSGPSGTLYERSLD